MGSNSIGSHKIKSNVSFLPLFRKWQKLIKSGKDGNRHLYQRLMEEISSYPELLEPISSEETLKNHAEVIERILATLFPVTFSDEEDMYAVLQPFNNKILYASSGFRRIFLHTDEEYVHAPNAASEESIKQEKLSGAYQMILKQLYQVETAGEMSSVHHFMCPETNLDRYMEVALDARFIDVFAEGDLPDLRITQLNGRSVFDIVKNDELLKQLPIEGFRFEGFVILEITEVTQREIINRIKNVLLEIHSYADDRIFGELDYHMQNLARVHQLHTAIKPFFMVNNHLVLSEIMTRNDTAKKYPLSEEKQYELYHNIASSFKASPEIVVVSDINKLTLERYPFLYILYEHNFKSVIIVPLFNEQKEILGILIIAHRTETLGYEHVDRIRPAIPLFAIALEKSQEHLDHQIDKVIKEQFTAVQEAVEWRFTKAALNYLTRKDKLQENKMEQIVFEQVYPLYGAIDIRNSSIERNNSIQLDILEQLQMAGDIVRKAQQLSHFPLLDELQYRIEKYTDSVSKILFAEEETSAHDFLTIEMVGVMSNLKPILPSLEKEISAYLDLINSPVRMLYHHRRQYEESITKINMQLAALIDEEQKIAQSIYPHYFERFVTDGLDYNIYAGQSITPRIAFNEFYLKNLKIWQLTTLVKAGLLSHALEKELSLPLRTTQLILAHSTPISISFRTAERKFDVDGAYNMRYEIIKKRIDKVKILNSNERLTQPGTISVVYSQNKEANEYLSYIEYLQSKGLLQDKVEKLELEELQGISGLKGLRAPINYEKGDQLLARLKEEPSQSMLLLNQA